MRKIGEPGNHTRAELEAMLSKMEAVSTAYYGLSVSTGCHAMIEFTGLMNEFIKVCRQTMEAGIDFSFANTHSDSPLVVHDYNAAYIAEKLDCILGPVLRADPATRATFLRAMELEAEPPPPPTLAAWARYKVNSLMHGIVRRRA